MNQHPIPQNISTYQFRLIGDMTLKQFGQIIVGLGIAIALYKTNLFFLLKWPLILLSVTAGIAAAFMPIQERPLDEWVNAFIKAIYAPTHFLWQKKHDLPKYFTFSPHSAVLTADEMKAMGELAVTRKRMGLSSFIQTINETKVSELDKQESAQMDQYLGLFNPQAFTPATPSSFQPTPLLTSPQTTVAIPIPKVSSVKIDIKPSNSPGNQPYRGQALYPAANHPQPLSTTVKTKTPAATTEATEDKTLPLPSVPTTPNTISGMVVSAAGKIVENAIIEIRSSDGIPIRATKTNRLGQFVSSTPLKNGTYEIEVDAPGLTFAIIKLELKGKVVNPIRLQAKA